MVKFFMSCGDVLVFQLLRSETDDPLLQNPSYVLSSYFDIDPISTVKNFGDSPLDEIQCLYFPNLQMLN